MGAINVLSKQISELIAAGEVIERPASVIKELVENCIDAGAHSITVEIQNGGTTFMRVSDDGCGIEREDVKNAFLRHATSKIKAADDLDAIATLGFRGEALASICAVSKVEIFTKSVKENEGTHYVIEGGEEKVFEAAGCPDGTTFIVRDIFYNVPARMKFLKKDVSEGNTVTVLLDRIALSHPEISINVIRDGKRVLKTQGTGKLGDAILQVFGKEFFSGLINVSYEYNGISVEGFVSKPVSSVKANRSMQVFIVNGRYVRTKTGMAALEQAYSGMIMSGKYPCCVLSIKMNCSMLDVNVHPAKLEIRFTNERPVYEAIYHAVRSSLMTFDTRNEDISAWDKIRITDPSLLSQPSDRGVQLGFSYGKKNGSGGYPKQQSFEKKPPVTIHSLNFLSFVDESTKTEPEAYSQKYVESDIVVQEDPAPEQQEEEIVHELPEQTDIMQDSSEVTIVDEDKITAPFRYIGQAFSTYIILEYDNDRLMFIDKHAAHERILYERIKAQNRTSESQMLLEPVSVIFDQEEYEIILEHKDMLLQAGFDIDAFGDKTIIVRSAPVFMESLDVSEEFSEIADYLCKHRKLILSEKMEWLIANTACRAAVKAGNISHDEELIDLAMTLEKNPEIRYCPHGRPVYFFMSKYEIEKSFKRV